MEYLSVFRVLRLHPILIGLGAFGAMLLAVAVSLQPSFLPARLTGTNTNSAAASTRLVLDARSEPAIDLASGTADTLGLRAGLLSDLLTTETTRSAIARSAGIKPYELAIIGPAMGRPPLAIPLALRATDAASTTTEPYVLTLSTDLEIPIITLRAGAPDVSSAARLVSTARASIEQIVATRATRGAGLIVRRLGLIRTETTVGERKSGVGFVLAILLFGAWLAAILVAHGLLRYLRGSGGGPPRKLSQRA
jgi:hypothetical protein